MGIKYSVRDLFDVNNYICLTYASHIVNVRAPSGISSL